MENSNNSCMNNTKAVACKGTTDCVPEESGWTKYFEDFSNYREHSFSSCLDNSSLVSDADSSALWKKSHNNLKLPKKTRTKIISVDDSLEDTASSPVNSPKVSDLSPVTMHPRKGKGDTLEHYPELQANERSEAIELKKFRKKTPPCAQALKAGEHRIGHRVVKDIQLQSHH